MDYTNKVYHKNGLKAIFYSKARIDKHKGFGCPRFTGEVSIVGGVSKPDFSNTDC